MTEKSTDRTAARGPPSAIRGLVPGHLVELLLAGAIAGYSLQLLTVEAVSVPGVGEVSGLAVGTVGLGVAGVAYLQGGRCGSCLWSTVGLRSGCREGGSCDDGC